MTRMPKEWRPGQRADYPGEGGYTYITIDGVEYRADRIMWKMATGEDVDELEHIDGDPANNRIANLRPKRVR